MQTSGGSGGGKGSGSGKRGRQERSGAGAQAVCVCQTIRVSVLLVDLAHERCGGRQRVVDEHEDGRISGKLDALANHVAGRENRESNIKREVSDCP